MNKTKLILLVFGLLLASPIVAIILELFIAAIYGVEIDWGWKEITWEDSLLERHRSYLLKEMPFLEGKTRNLKLVYHKRGLLGTGIRGHDLWGRVDFEEDELSNLKGKLFQKFYYSGTPLPQNYESEELIRMLSIPCDWNEMYLVWHVSDLDVYMDSKSISRILNQKKMFS